MIRRSTDAHVFYSSEDTVRMLKLLVGMLFEILVALHKYLS